MIPNFPKIQCPFVRKEFNVNYEDWKTHGFKLQLRIPKVRLVQPEINKGYEWVFEDKDTIAVEKLNGTCVQLVVENGRLIHVQNRLNLIDPLQIMKGKTFIIEGIFRSIQKGYVKPNGEQVGEIIGPKLQGNPYELEYHLWYPFSKSVKDLTYRSFHEYDRTFDNFSSWFKDYIVSRFHAKLSKPEDNKDKVFAEGIIFYNLKRKSEGKVYMAKLRRDMYEWYYSDYIRIEK